MSEPQQLRATGTEDAAPRRLALVKPDERPQPVRLDLEWAGDLEQIARRSEAIGLLRETAIKFTAPEHYVVSRSEDGRMIASLNASGAELVAQIYGIQISNIRPTDPQGRFEPKAVEEGNETQFVAWGTGTCKVTGVEADVRFARSNTESFVGGGPRRSSKLVRLEDVRSCVLTGLRTKIIKSLSGFKSVPVAELSRHWDGTGKDVKDCIQGSGFGSSTERKAEKVAEEGVKEAAGKLAKEILARVGGDQSAAEDLLQDITKGKNFKGRRSAKTFTQMWQVDNAWEALRAHSVFGDSQQGGAA